MKEHFDKYFRAILHYCVKAVKSNEDAEEIAIDSFVQLYKRGGIDSNEGAKAFLFRVARNKCISHIKHKRSREVIKTTEMPNDALLADHCEINAMVINDLYDKINKEVDNLTGRQKEIIKLYLAGNSPRDISDKLGIKYKTVCNWKDTAINTLKSKLQWCKKEYINN